LPGYAPELNPDEGIWKHLKYVELKNICCRSLSELRQELPTAAFAKVEPPPQVIIGRIRQHAATFQVTGEHPAANPEDQY
jgi:hypothetical protein